MDVFEQMSLHEGALTPAEHAVYDIVKSHPDAVLGSTSNELARRYGVSQSAVSRFCKRLGFAGYGDFRMELHRSLMLQRFEGEDSAESKLDYVGCMERLLRSTRSVIETPKASEAIERLFRAKNVYAFGAGQSSVPARMLAGRLGEDSVPAHYVEWGYEAEILHYVAKDDVLVFFSSKNSTFSNALATTTSLQTEKRPHTLLVTHTARHPHVKLVDDVIVLPTWETLGLPLYLEPQYSMVFLCMLISDQ